jgi:proton-dependent oligopeptide transporter, POT family
MQNVEEIQNFKGQYPKQLVYLFFSEMWERFCFYGMRGMLAVFMVSQLNMTEKIANLQYGATQAWVYAFTFIGGIFADRILGLRKSLFWGGLLMIAGSVILAINPKEFFFLGISVTIVGTGFFKPNISSMVGQLYHENDSRRDAGFSFFYMGVNIGALIGGYLCISVAEGDLWASLIPENLRWNVAFGFAAVVMLISLLTFTQTQKTLGSIGLSPLRADLPNKKIIEIATYIGSLAIIPLILVAVENTDYTDWFMYFIGPFSVVYLLFEMRNFTKIENQRLLAALLLMLFSIVFWSFFEQSGGSLALFSNTLIRDTFFGFSLNPTGVNNAANSLFVILFATVIGYIWVKLSKINREPNTTIKFGLGFVFLALGFVVFYLCKDTANTEAKTSLELFTFGWLWISVGELCLSPIGMSAMTKLSPQKVQAMIMGMWFLASAYGQYFAGLLGANIAEASEKSSKMIKLTIYTDGYLALGIYGLIAGILLIALSGLIKRLSHGVR